MKTQRWLTCALLATAAVLSACGGGGSEDDTSMAEDENGKVPTSATSSIQAFIGFVGAQKAHDSAEPLSLQGMTPPPTSETAEPVDVV